jgi:hypothetical protein
VVFNFLVAVKWLFLVKKPELIGWTYNVKESVRLDMGSWGLTTVSGVGLGLGWCGGGGRT